jgi:hypothetical protein
MSGRYRVATRRLKSKGVGKVTEALCVFVQLFSFETLSVRLKFRSTLSRRGVKRLGARIILFFSFHHMYCNKKRNLRHAN